MDATTAARPPRHVVAIGCSWGGLDATSAVLESLPADLDAAVLVVQHRRHAPSDLARLLGRHTPWPVCEADDKEVIGARRVYLAAPGYHLLVDASPGPGAPPRLALSTEAPVQHSRPSVDVLFESVADGFGARAVGVVLTGANEDGAAGVGRLLAAGASVIVQDPAGAERREMPDAAIAAARAATVPDGAWTVVPLAEVGASIARLVGARAQGSAAT